MQAESIGFRNLNLNGPQESLQSAGSGTLRSPSLSRLVAKRRTPGPFDVKNGIQDSDRHKQGRVPSSGHSGLKLPTSSVLSGN